MKHRTALGVALPLSVIAALLVAFPGPGAGASPAHSLGTRQTGVLRPVRSVNVRQIAAQSAGGAESNFSSELPNHPTELQKGMGSPQYDIPPPTPPSTPIVEFGGMVR